MTATPVPRQLDDVDRLLLDIVQDDARISLTDLGQRLSLSVSATRARLRALDERGVITCWRAAIDPRAVGYDLHAVVRVKVHGALYDQLRAVLDDEPQITRCLRVTGEACYVAEVLARDMADLERITTRLARVGSITTDLVYETVTDAPTPAMPASGPVG